MFYELNEVESFVFAEYYRIKQSPNDNNAKTVKLQSILEQLLKELCEQKYKKTVDNISKAVQTLKSDDTYLDKNTNKNNDYKTFVKHFFIFLNNIKNINDSANHEKHSQNAAIEDVKFEFYQKCLHECIEWYFKHFRAKKFDDLFTTNTEAKLAIKMYFVSHPIIELVPQRDFHYVLLLIDSSQSMLWPYLETQENRNNFGSPDYIQALKKAQEAITYAQEKALAALRGSAACQKRTMFICQYLFNTTPVLLNKPELLSPYEDDQDNVIRLSTKNYTPDGATALHETIEESLKYLYNSYLIPNKEKYGRIDKLTIGVITDGENSIFRQSIDYSNPLYIPIQKEKINSIKEWIEKLRSKNNPRESHLNSSVIIGLTNKTFNDKDLNEVKKELCFDESIAIDQGSEKSLRSAFKTVSTNAIND